MGLLPNVAALTILSLALYHLYRLYTRISVAKVPGPPSSSFIYGNLPELMQSQAGEVCHDLLPSRSSPDPCYPLQADFKWQSTYGHVIKLKAPLGVRGLEYCPLSLADQCLGGRAIDLRPESSAVHLSDCGVSISEASREKHVRPHSDWS